MFGDRWTRIQRERGALAALHAPGLTLTFAELDSQARALRPDGDVFVARGDTPDILRATLAGLLQGVPVQWVEKDRSRRVPAMPPPAGTAFLP